MSRITLLTLCILSLLATPALAQEPTRQPQQNYISSWTTEVIFPQAIRFDVVLGIAADDVASVTLTIQPEDRSAEQITVNIAEARVVSEPYSELAYMWEIPRNEPPYLFREVDVQWRVVSKQDEVAQVDDTFIFTDQRVEWAQDADSHLALSMPDGGQDPARLRRELMPVYDLLAANVGRTPSFNLILYRDNLSATGCVTNADGDLVAVGPVSGVEVDCDPTMAEAIFSASGYEAIELHGASSVQETIVARLVDGFYEQVWAGKTVPDWFRVGLQQFYAPNPKTSLLPLLLTAARNDRLFTLGEMASIPDSDTDVWRAQSYGMVLYIADQIGVPELFGLASAVGTAETFEAAYLSVVRQPLSALMVNWERWLFTDDGAAAFAFTVYQASTPTPTASPSLTPFPPTETPTLTLTAPPTVTLTVTGVLSPTPLPTRTRTPIPDTATPSVTPRPAGSLNTAMPVPAQTGAQVSPTTRSAGIATVILLLVVIIALVYLRWFRQR